jgi:hypothetical protein
VIAFLSTAPVSSLHFFPVCALNAPRSVFSCSFSWKLGWGVLVTSVLGPLVAPIVTQRLSSFQAYLLNGSPFLHVKHSSHLPLISGQSNNHDDVQARPPRRASSPTPPLLLRPEGGIVVANIMRRRRLPEPIVVRVVILSPPPPPPSIRDDPPSPSPPTAR